MVFVNLVLLFAASLLMGGAVFLSCLLLGLGRPGLMLAGRLVELGLNVGKQISGGALADLHFIGP